VSPVLGVVRPALGAFKVVKAAAGLGLAALSAVEAVAVVAVGLVNSAGRETPPPP